MLEVIKRTGVGALLLMILPLILWASGWQWRPESNYSLLKGLYWLTQTVTPPWGTITSTLLIGWFLWCLHYPLKLALRLIIILITTILIGQGIKLFIKEQVQEPRPFVVWLNRYYDINNQTFYAMPRKARATIVAKELQQQKMIPPWLQDHWRDESGFSFPSGHTIFAGSWALLAIGLLWPYRYWVSTTGLMLWASGVMVSRIAIGMHWPRDVVMGIAISWLVITLECWLVQRWIGMPTPIADKDTANFR
ncbi:MAG: phosphatidylglycerophosphatase B [Sodalis sp. (in: enterobacteria)]